MDSSAQSTVGSGHTTIVLPSNGQLLAEETEGLIMTSLSAMRADLAERPAWSGAPPPADSFLLMFLRAEVFSAAKAADRYRKFWEMKVFICGEDKAALPIKAEDADTALKLEFIQLVPGSKDVEGRQVVLVNTGNADKSVDKKKRVLAVWYVLLAALEDVETQRKGLCFVITLKTAKLKQMDPKASKMVMESMQGALPVRIGSMNLCYPPSFFRLVWLIMSPFLHKRVKKRVRVIPGTDSEVRKTLGYIVAEDNLPPPMGEKVLNFSCWLAQRAQIET